MQSVLGFLIILGPLVVFHELGHFLFAKLFGVRADVFSVGFGPKIWRKKIGETEWALSAIPLGGYVKLFGAEPGVEIDEKDWHRSLHSKDPWQRFLIYFGGPLFNLILAAFIFMVILAIGEPKISNFAGRVVYGTPAYDSGLRTGDKIVTVDGKRTPTFRDIDSVIHENPGKVLDFQINRGEKTETLPVRIGTKIGYSVYGEHTEVGVLYGLYPMARASTVGVADPNSLAGKAEIRTGDRIIEFNGQEVTRWHQIEKMYREVDAGSPISLKLERELDSGKEKTKGKEVPKTTYTVSITKPDIKRDVPEDLDIVGDDLGLFSSELFIQKVVDDSPADTIGIQKNDRLVSISGTPIHSFYALKRTIADEARKAKEIEVVWQSKNEMKKEVVQPTLTEGRDLILKKTEDYTIGVYPYLVFAKPDTVLHQVWNPFMLVYESVARVADFIWKNFVSILKMVVGQVSVATLGGPILIGKIAGDTLEQGWMSFLNMMAIISVGLGFINLLPIPVLDGGHLMLLAIEVIRRRPLTVRQMEIVQQVGLSLILLLMAVVMRNDIARISFFN